ncbi:MULTISPECIES: amidase [unclassified Acinetobacter]|uniref:amidase n=1 Tax=unclassified Acinetobacter TaxID=196816 RepID=UPI002934C8B5|nr:MULTISPECIES: amidase [unclassified Acinetobacter]WOE32621.1 amidase [Acinetobacter sp. SAAs470]WOE38097.1 amidase [Acinetobacter sp. SAAs474]
MNIITQDLQIGSGRLNVMIKDSIDIQGFKTTLASKAMENTIPAAKNATVVERILAADCQITAKTNLHELAFGITGINDAFGTAINPKYPQLIPGGSSSGSAAAVAAQLADFTLGTDTGGSIRMPAACCGVFGLKPTFDRISRCGIHPQYSSLDCVGPLANSVEMIETAMQIIDPSFVIAAAITQAPKLAYLAVSATEEVYQTIMDYLTQAGLQPDCVDVIFFDDAFEAGMHMINFENWQAYHALTQTGLVGVDVNTRLLAAAETTQQQVEQAQRIKLKFSQEIDALLAEYDALVLPTLAQTPPKLVDAKQDAGLLNLTKLVRPFNLSGHPAISIPLISQQNLPVGLQIIASHYADEKLCAIAQFIVQAAASHKELMSDE